MLTSSLNGNFDSSNVGDTLLPRLAKIEQQSGSLLATMSSKENLTAQELMQMQVQLQNIGVTTQLAATIVKSLGDVMKDVVSKAG